MLLITICPGICHLIVAVHLLTAFSFASMVHGLYYNDELHFEICTDGIHRMINIEF